MASISAAASRPILGRRGVEARGLGAGCQPRPLRAPAGLAWGAGLPVRPLSRGAGAVRAAYTPGTYARRAAAPPAPPLWGQPGAGGLKGAARGAAPPSRRDVAMASGGGKVDEGSHRMVLYNERWVQLGILSLLALLSDWICFSMVAAPGVWENAQGHDFAELLDLFLFVNVASCLFFTDIAKKFGLKNVVVAASILMSAGALLRSGIPFINDGLPSYAMITAGTVLVGAAQPFFQCTPPLLSATWFGNKERALSTAIAINFNQVGIATAFIVGGLLVKDPVDLPFYFSTISVFTVAITAATVLLFKDRPPTPPSASAAAAIASHDDERSKPFSFDYPKTAMDLIRVPGFAFPLAAFVASIGVSNVVSTFTAEDLGRAGFTDQFGIDVAGAGFQMAIVLGGVLVGGYVDRTKKFKTVTLSLLSSALGVLVFLGVAEGYKLDVPPQLFITALLLLGATIGPVQPINAELAVEVAYPGDENAIEATQQLCGNLFSALLVPIAQAAAAYDLVVLPILDIGPGKISGEDIRGDTLCLIALTLVTFLYFSKFDAPLKREEADSLDEDVGEKEAVMAGGGSGEDST